MKKKNEIQWSSRIVGFYEKPAEEFNFNPLNWKIHTSRQRNAISGILSAIGWVTGVIENRQTNNLIDGHARIEEALRTNPKMKIPYLLVDLTEDEEKTILALMDPIGNLAETDEDLLLALRNSVTIDNEEFLNILSDLTSSIEIPEFKEFTEEVEKEVEYLTCPQCSHRFPK